MDNSTDGVNAQDQPFGDDDDDFQLMEWIALYRDDDAVTAQQAWACLYTRHQPYLVKIVFNQVTNAFGSQLTAEDVANETFRKVYEKAPTFAPPSDAKTTEAKRNVFRAWMGQIAANVIRDAQRDQKKFSTVNIDEEYWADIPSNTPFEGLGDQARVQHVMKQALSKREQEILTTTYHYHHPGSKLDPQLPPEEVQRICEKYGITPENLRQIRSRSLKKLREALTAYGMAR